jgi:hypothetical protein
MPIDPDVLARAALLDDFAMVYETSVTIFPAEDTLKEFCAHFEIEGAGLALVPSPEGFYGTLKEVCGYDVWQPIAGKTAELFGMPSRVTVFEDVSAVTEKLEGEDGLGPFFFVFDVMFCEYGGFTLCFISGTNN